MNATEGQVEAVNGVMPDVPKSERACGTMRDGEIYNFDQRLRLKLQIENVRDERMKRQLNEEQKKKERIMCTIVNRIRATVVEKAKSQFAGGTGWGSVLIGLGVDIALDSLTYKMSTKEYDCSKPEYQFQTVAPAKAPG